MSQSQSHIDKNVRASGKKHVNSDARARKRRGMLDML